MHFFFCFLHFLHFIFTFWPTLAVPFSRNLPPFLPVLFVFPSCFLSFSQSLYFFPLVFVFLFTLLLIFKIWVNISLFYFPLPVFSLAVFVFLFLFYICFFCTRFLAFFLNTNTHKTQYTVYTQWWNESIFTQLLMWKFEDFMQLQFYLLYWVYEANTAFSTPLLYIFYVAITYFKPLLLCGNVLLRRQIFVVNSVFTFKRWLPKPKPKPKKQKQTHKD